MRKFVEKIRNMPLALAAAATIAITEAQAEGTVGDAASNMMDDVGNVGKLAVAGGFLMGLVMVATGLIRLKAAAESQGGQVKYSEGLWRVAVGAGLVTIPAFTGMLSETLGLGAPATIQEAGGASF